MEPPFEVDSERVGLHETGFYVRAQRDGHWVNADISHLTYESLVRWLNQDHTHSGHSMAVVLVLRWLGWEIQPR